MDLATITENIPWSSVQSCISFFNKRNITINDTELFDQWINLKIVCQKLTEEDKKLNMNEL